MKKIRLQLFLIIFILTGCLTVSSDNISTGSIEAGDPMNGNADVIYVKAIETNKNEWTFHVTVTHPDTGWDDYADGWNVEMEDGTVIKRYQISNFTRILLHPHISEQPFTRSQVGLPIPDNTQSVIVKAHDLDDGFGGKEIRVDLSKDEGDYYEVERFNN